jgi:hypothetical protein
VFAPAALAITVVCPALKNLISTFESDTYKLDEKVIKQYATLALGVRNPDEIVDLLKSKNPVIPHM